ncbi:DUF47 family protein [Candidatus Micrarchaeota archaeon]|nr:DUF47 family protein [Candidatus Micrarchaeota archaeon]
MALTRLKHMLVPQDQVFFEKLEKQTQIAHQAATKLQALMHNYQNPKKTAQEIKAIEQAGDDLMHELYVELNKSFIVPLDHADISALATALDDVLDWINVAAKYLAVYEIQNATPGMIKLSDLVYQQTQLLEETVKALRHPKTIHMASQGCEELNRLENEADEVYTQTLAKLFKTSDAIQLLKEKQVLDALEHATDDVERAANVLTDIVMKHA